MVVWLTGLSGSGKTTLAQAVAARWRATGRRVEVLDGDVVRDILPATGFDRAARSRHVRTIGWLASRLEAHDVDVLCAFISPYADDRAFVRSLCATFVEVHVATDLATCQARDPKGLYARVAAGEIRGFTGIDDPYEAPAQAELTLDAAAGTVEEGVDAIETLVTALRDGA